MFLFNCFGSLTDFKKDLDFHMVTVSIDFSETLFDDRKYLADIRGSDIFPLSLNSIFFSSSSLLRPTEYYMVSVRSYSSDGIFFWLRSSSSTGTDCTSPYFSMH